MRLAYADPPYPGQAKRLYGNHPDYAGEVDHAELIGRLERDYDGWALSTSMVALRDILPLTPARALVAAWFVTNAAPPGHKGWWHWYAWEPVIVAPVRPRPDVRNTLACHIQNGFYLGRNGETAFPGRKPEAFCNWVFALVGAEPGDDFEDLFPGSGAVGHAWERFRTQTRLAL